MKTLSEFLARHIIDRQDYFGPNAEEEYESMIKWYGEDIAEGIKAYERHLQDDSPKTVSVAMIEKDLITALERMQSRDSLNDHKLISICPFLTAHASFGCDDCQLHPTCDVKENKIDVSGVPNADTKELIEGSSSKKYKCQCGHFFNEPCIIDPYGSSISPRCPECGSKTFTEY